MKMLKLFATLVVSAACLASQVLSAQEPVKASKPELAIQSAAENDKLIYLLFCKANDAATMALADTIDEAVKGQSGQSTSCVVRLNDPAERLVAEKYQLTRAPMPMVIGVHPNGAVTGYFNGKTTVEQLSQCVVSAKKAECMKALQQNQLVLVCLQTQPKQGIPVGVRGLQADPHFAKRTHVVTVAVNDPAEASFLAGMDVNPKSTIPLTVFLAPPGAMVGKFSTTATKEQLAAKLAEAGKCCNDENCKHNAASQAQQPRKVVR